MKRVAMSGLLLSAILATLVDPSTAGSPVVKAIAMISDLQAKVVKEGETAQKEFAEFSEWCEDRSRDLGNEIKTGNSQVGELTATIDEQKAKASSLTAKVEDLVKSIASDTKDLKDATTVREAERADFMAEEKELMETIGVLERAITVLEKELRGGASMLQLQGARSLAQALSVMVQASLVGSSDASKLTALVQQSQHDADEDQDTALGAPAAAAYEGKSSGIVDTLQDLLDKAQGQLDDARKKEEASANNYAMLKQSLEDEIKFANKDMGEAKKGIAASAEKKSVAEGELQTTSKALAADVKSKEGLHHDCMTKAEEFELEVKSRDEELKATTQAKKLLQEVVDGGEFSQVSFVQLARLQAVAESNTARSNAASTTELAHYDVVKLMRELARQQQSRSLAQLASRIMSALRVQGGADPLEKVQGLITDMIAKLEKEAQADADKKAYCDKELAETKEKKADKSESIEKLGTKIEQMTARSAKLKEEIAVLQSELSKLSKSQAEMDKLRQEEKEIYDTTKAEQEKGLAGIKKALQVLRDYYSKSDTAHGSSSGAASGIIGLLETVESDITRNLAEITSDEESAVTEYEKVTDDNKIEKTTKEQDVSYKTKESKSLDKESADVTSDRNGEQEQLDAVLEYFAKIKGECIAKPEAYEERKKRREAELAGLKEGLRVLESEASLVQQHATRRTLRGGSSISRSAALLQPSVSA